LRSSGYTTFAAVTDPDVLPERRFGRGFDVFDDLDSAEHVIFGSDWPHTEGLPGPRGILEEIAGLDETARELFRRGNARRLNERR